VVGRRDDPEEDDRAKPSACRHGRGPPGKAEHEGPFFVRRRARLLQPAPDPAEPAPLDPVADQRGRDEVRRRDHHEEEPLAVRRLGLRRRYEAEVDERHARADEVRREVSSVERLEHLRPLRLAAITFHDRGGFHRLG
jgi:hypothetical protein